MANWLLSVPPDVRMISSGFADSDAYLDTDRPSLYDAFNDMYGEPSKPKKSERMVALSNPNVVEQRERPAENLRANRQFSAVRRGVAVVATLHSNSERSAVRSFASRVAERLGALEVFSSERDADPFVVA